MVKQLIDFLIRYVRGEEINVQFELEFTWLEVLLLIIIVALIIRWIWM